MKIIYIFLIIGLAACATSSRLKNDLLNKLVNSQDYDSALKYVKSEKFYSSENSELLRLLEEATILHLKGDYYASIKIFEKAKNLSDKLFTISLSKKIQSFAVNNSSDEFYGQLYEKSFIRFYLALNNYIIYKEGKYSVTSNEKEQVKELTQDEKRTHLFAARASLLDWDTLLESYRLKFPGDIYYKDDLAAKIIGALIHREVNQLEDRQIAKGLIKKSSEVLLKNYNLFPSFNNVSDIFKKNFTDFHKFGEDKVRKFYVKPTTYQNQLTSFLKEDHFSHNVAVLLQEGRIAKRIVKEYEFPLPIIGTGSGSSYVSSGTNLFDFAFQILHLGGATHPTISYELPSVENKPFKRNVKIILTDKAGKFVKESPIHLINPMSEISYHSFQNEIGGIKTKIGTRVATKHLAAITSAYAAYKTSVSNKMNPLAARFLAAAMYATSNKMIKQSEKADLRYWSTLPNSLLFTSFSLPNGDYLYKVQNAQGINLDTGELKVVDKEISFINIIQG